MATKKTSKTTKTEETKAAAVGSEDLAGLNEETRTRDESENNPIPSDEQGYPLPTEEQAARRDGPK